MYVDNQAQNPGGALMVVALVQDEVVAAISSEAAQLFGASSDQIRSWPAGAYRNLVHSGDRDRIFGRNGHTPYIARGSISRAVCRPGTPGHREIWTDLYIWQIRLAGREADLLIFCTRPDMELSSPPLTLENPAPAKSPSILFLTDPAGMIVAAGSNPHNSLGLEQGNIFGHRLLDLFAPQSRELALGAPPPGFMRPGSCRDIPYQLQLPKTGIMDVMLSAATFNLPGDQPALAAVVLTDVSRHAEVGRQIQEYASVLTQRNQDLKQFALTLSHDLKEPLRMVTSFSAMLGEEYGDQLDEKANDYINTIRNSATRMQRMIQGLYDYTRMNSPSDLSETVDCQEVAHVALLNLNLAVSESAAQIRTGRLPSVQGNRTQLVLLFQNLLGNAIKFRGEHNPRIELSAHPEGDMWELELADNGIGIKPEFHMRIFTMFQRLNGPDRFPGDGIGLALCETIVSRHGGRIWVESAPGQGSTFHFTLPNAN